MESRGVAMRFGIAGVLIGALASVIPHARVDSARGPGAAEPSRPRPVVIKAPNINTFNEGTKLLGAYCGEGWTSPDSARTCGGTTVSAQFIIATLADPHDSHLDYSFDADLEALRRAFETAGYIIDRYWLPGPEDTVHLGDAGARVRRDVHPGVLLLRHIESQRNTVSIAYIVGETPTRGIAKDAFANALRERQRLMQARAVQRASRPDTVRIIGPSFSGSAPSLARAIRTYVRSCRGKSCPSHYRVISGSATDAGVKDVLTALACVSYATTVNPDHRLEGISAKVIRRLYGEAARVAMLRETSTQYGAASGRDSAQVLASDSTLLKRTLVIPFPLNITSVRAEYERNPVTPPQTSAVALDEAARVPLALSEATRTRETPGTTSNVTPAVLDLALRNIIDELRQNEITVAGILATNVRDKLFLADLIKRHLPDIQLFTYESSLLYLHKDYNRAMRGMLVFSSYPLFLKNQEWVQRTVDGRRLAPTRVPFATDASEGIYNATLLQLGEADKLIEYGLPQWQLGPRRVPVWVSAVGSQSFIPLYVYPATFPWHYANVAEAPATPLPRYSVYAEMQWELAALFAIFTAALVAVAVLYWKRLRHPIPSAASDVSDPRQLYGRVETALGQMWLDLCVFLGMVGLATISFPLAYTLLRASERAQEVAWLFILALAPWLVVTLVSFGRVVIGIKRNLRCAARWLINPIKGWWRAVVLLEGTAYLALLAFGIGFLMLILLYTWEIRSIARTCGAAHSGPCDPVMLATFRMFYYRATALASGVSPLAPLMVSAAGLVTWSLWHVHRLTALQKATPFENAILGDPDTRTSAGPATPHQDKMLRLLAPYVARARRYLLTLVPRLGTLLVAAIIFMFVIFAAVQFQPTIEAVAFEGWLLRLTTFDILLLLSVAGAIVGTGWGVYRLGVMWESVSEMLRHVSETPLLDSIKRAMEKFPNLQPLNPFSSAAADDMEVRSKDAWKNASAIVAGNDWPQASQAEPQLAAALKLATPPQSSWSWKDDDAPGKFTGVYGGLGALNEAEPDAAALGLPAGPLPSRMPLAIREWRRQADTFIALQAILYVDWAQDQVRKQALSLLTALLLTTLLLSVYPFQPRSVVKIIFLGIMVISIGVMTLVLTQMNRDPVLSVISRSTPGQVNWNSGYVLRIGLYAALPVLALLSSEYSAIGNVLFAWLEPLAQFLGKM